MLLTKHNASGNYNNLTTTPNNHVTHLQYVDDGGQVWGDVLTCDGHQLRQLHQNTLTQTRPRLAHNLRTQNQVRGLVSNQIQK